MSKPLSYSPTLVARNGRIACRACDHELADVGAAWKEHAALDERALHEAGGQTYRTDGDVLLRQFCCPGCGALLDTETALPGEPFLFDRLEVEVHE